MENWLLIDNNALIDHCLATSITTAQQIFNSRGWVIGEVISEADAIIEASQNAMENESPEC